VGGDMAHDSAADSKRVRRTRLLPAATRSRASSPSQRPGLYRLRRTLRAVTGAVLVVASPGCSFILTRGPEPEVHPPPPCPTSVEAPVGDTVLAISSAIVAGLGVALWATSCSPTELVCINRVGWIGAAVGGPLAILFTASAATGFSRTTACREFLAADAVPAHASVGAAVPATSLLALSPTPGCFGKADAPRVCWMPTSARPAWETEPGAPR
jgi:hypothetical protein